MIRIFHTACAAALVIVALIAHGIKEEKRALDQEVARLTAERAALVAAIERERAEWAHLNGPDSLRRVAEHVYGVGPWSPTSSRGDAGARGGLGAIAPGQIVDIRTLAYRNPALRRDARAPFQRGGTAQ